MSRFSSNSPRNILRGSGASWETYSLQHLRGVLLGNSWKLRRGCPSETDARATFAESSQHRGASASIWATLRSLPWFMTIGESRSVDWPINRELCLATKLSVYHKGPVHWLHNCRGCIDPPTNLMFHLSLTCEQHTFPPFLNHHLTMLEGFACPDDPGSQSVPS